MQGAAKKHKRELPNLGYLTKKTRNVIGVNYGNQGGLKSLLAKCMV